MPAIDEDWLTISTMHSAKGMEWDVVHVIHAADGNIPLGHGPQRPQRSGGGAPPVLRGDDPPRREAHVYVPLRYHHRPAGRDDRHSWAQPSRFLTDNVAATMDQVTLLRDDATDAADFATVDTTTAVDAHLGGLFG